MLNQSSSSMQNSSDPVEQPASGPVVDAYALTWPEIKALAERNAVVILTVGALESHGPHLPAGSDTIKYFPVSREIARRLSATGLPALVGMHIPFGNPELPHRLVPGVMVKPLTLFNVMLDVLEGFHRCEFRRFAILPGHWGNFDICSAAARAFAAATEASVVLVTGAGLEGKFIAERSRSRWPVFGDEWHAGESETARMLYLFPELCHMEQASAERAADMARLVAAGSNLEVAPLFFSRDYDLGTESGYYGDAMAATRESGEYLVGTFVQSAVDQIRAVFG